MAHRDQRRERNIYYIEPYKQTGTLRLDYIYWYLDIHNLDISNNIYVCSGCVLVLACWLTVVAGDGYGHGHSSHGIGTACIVKVDTYLHISTHIYSYLLIYLPFRGATASATTASVRRDTFTVKDTATEADMVSWNEKTFAKFHNHVGLSPRM